MRHVKSSEIVHIKIAFSTISLTNRTLDLSTVTQRTPKRKTRWCPLNSHRAISRIWYLLNVDIYRPFILPRQMSEVSVTFWKGHMKWSPFCFGATFFTPCNQRGISQEKRVPAYHPPRPRWRVITKLPFNGRLCRLPSHRRAPGCHRTHPRGGQDT